MQEKISTYFAAANSYRGFISYFDKIFPSTEFEKIFVLKGGPGTGKSSLMRSISQKLGSEGFDIEHILCSSDPKSLDGVIAQKDDKKIAVIDGTAPHERDAVIPGAIDEIVNLGHNWDERWLRAKRSEILSLNEEKRSAYKTAYNYLKIAGECSSAMDEVRTKHFIKTEAKNEAERILSSVSTFGEGQIYTRLFSSFGRLGDYSIKPQKDQFSRVVSVGGEADMFLKVCQDLLISKGANMTIFPSAKDPKKLDALLINDEDILILSDEKYEIDAGEFLVIPPVDKEKIRLASELHRELLIESARWFKIASEIHFTIEEIYSSAMDFTRNDALLSEIYAKIGLIYENS